MGSVPKVGFKVGCSADVARGAHPIVRPGCSNSSLEKGMEKFLRASSNILEVSGRKSGVAQSKKKKRRCNRNGGQRGNQQKERVRSVWRNSQDQSGQSVTAHSGQMQGRTMCPSVCRRCLFPAADPGTATAGGIPYRLFFRLWGRLVSAPGPVHVLAGNGEKRETLKGMSPAQVFYAMLYQDLGVAPAGHLMQEIIDLTASRSMCLSSVLKRAPTPQKLLQNGYLDLYLPTYNSIPN